MLYTDEVFSLIRGPVYNSRPMFLIFRNDS